MHFIGTWDVSIPPWDRFRGCAGKVEIPKPVMYGIENSDQSMGYMKRCGHFRMVSHHIH